MLWIIGLAIFMFVLVGWRGIGFDTEEQEIVSQHRARVIVGGSTRLRQEARREYLELIGEEDRHYDETFYSSVEMP